MIDEGNLAKEGPSMWKWITRIVGVIIIAFVIFYVFTRPEESAAAVRTFFGAFDSLIRFFEALVSKGG
jgi:succinate dehydrogenase hydrophobic anchor subunit